MVVEDEPDIYEVLLAMFEMWGIEGVAFVDGEEAIDWIDDVDAERFQGELPELGLLDIKLPGEVDGIMVGERLRKSPILGNMCLVLTTAYRLSPEDQAEAMERAQADLWIPKPLPVFKELQTILEEAIAKRRAMKQEALKEDDTEPTKDADISEAVKEVETTESTDETS